MMASSLVFSVVVYQLLHDVGRFMLGVESVGHIRRMILGLGFSVGPSLKKSKLSKQRLDSV